jgi:hypothetical protein
MLWHEDFDMHVGDLGCPSPVPVRQRKLSFDLGVGDLPPLKPMDFAEAKGFPASPKDEKESVTESGWEGRLSELAGRRIYLTSSRLIDLLKLIPPALHKSAPERISESARRGLKALSETYLPEAMRDTLELRADYAMTLARAILHSGLSDVEKARALAPQGSHDSRQDLNGARAIVRMILASDLSMQSKHTCFRHWIAASVDTGLYDEACAVYTAVVDGNPRSPFQISDELGARLFTGFLYRRHRAL